MKGRDRKHRLFNEGALSIASVTGTREALYACPLCLDVHNAASIERGDLTEEHVPPRSIGGKSLVLTCKPCNTRAGSSIDAALSKRKDFIGLTRSLGGTGRFQGRVRLTMGGVTTNTNATIENGKMEMVAPIGINDPKKHSSLFKHLDNLYERNTWDGEKFQIKPNLAVNMRLAQLSDLKTAYLAAFASLGYRYIARSELDVVREQIRVPENKIIQLFFCGLSSEIVARLSIRSVEYPFKAIAVQIGNSFFFLPPVSGGARFYDELRDNLAAAQGCDRISGSEWDWPTWSHFYLDRRKSI